MFSIIMIISGMGLSCALFQLYAKKKRKTDRNIGIALAVLTALLTLSTVSAYF